MLTSGGAGGLPGMTLKAYGLLDLAAGVVVKGVNVSSYSGGVVNLAAAMQSTRYVVKTIPMANEAVVASGKPVTASSFSLAMYRPQDSVQISGLIWFEVYE